MMWTSLCCERVGFTNVAERPWFLIYNPYYGPSRFFRYTADPFPITDFPAISPWEDCTIVAHFGCDALARRAGWDDTAAYLLALIRSAATGALTGA